MTPRVCPWLALFGGALLSVLPAARAAEARPFLSPVFGDHMVLQRGRPNPFWGWTQPGAKVRVSEAADTAEAQADGSGRWQAVLGPLPAGGPYEIRIEGPETVVLHDVLSGDLWLCGGQSNMVFPLAGAEGGKAEAQAANDPKLRFFRVADRSAYAPAETLKGQWELCTPRSAAGFSAVAYYFARGIRQKLDVPIGLIQSCVGGSPAESWMSAEALAPLGDFEPQLAQIQKLHEKGAPETGSFLMNWLAEYDLGDKGNAWAQPGLDDHDWKPVTIPGGVADLGMAGVPSVCWFRREIDLPDPAPAGPARIFLGVVGKMETTYVNGRWVGASSWVENPRIYPIPAGVLHPGRNLIAVRVFQSGPGGGFLSEPKVLRIALGEGPSLPLAGPWRGKVSVDARPPHPLPLDLENYPTMPTVLYNGMIAPVAPLAIAGVLWYQGEANQFKAAQYRKLLPALIADWRRAFGQPNLPFYVVGLPAFTARRSAPGEDGWTEVREAQADTVKAVPDTALAVTVDTGDPNNIHPTRKQPVGERLALDALALHYGLKVPYRGPEFAAAETLPGALRLHFAHADGGLTVHGPVLGEFSVAGQDHVWHWAQAKLEGADTIQVSSPDVPAPVAARYAWQANPLASLYNGAGLPAEPFRTDDWPER